MDAKTKKDVGAVIYHSGVSFRLWAPFAETVNIIGSFNSWTETAMSSEGDGYWHTFIRGAKAGQEYKFVIRRDGQTHYRNDPRALHFTTSSGVSVVAEPAFDWGDVAFTPPPANEQVIYELHVGTFNRPDLATNGTFLDVIAKLDYLSELGVNMIELMPIGSMLMDRGWGYAIDYIFAVESLYGGRRGFLQFVKAAHERGIGVILDVVYNHFGPDTNLDLWQFDGWSENDMGGIYFYNDRRAETPWGNTRPDFGRAEVRQYILDNVRMWLHDCRVDGLRVDSTIFIRNIKGYNDDPGNDLPEGWMLLQEINTAARKLNPSAITIAEDTACNEYINKPTKDGGAGFNAQWEHGFRSALLEALHSDDLAAVNMTGFCGQLYRRYNDDPFGRVMFMDSHDSAANGSARWNELVAPGKASDPFARKQSLIAAGLLLTTPGIPMLFQGQEFLEGGSFNDWEALDWAKAKQYRGMTLAYKDLIALRRDLAGVSRGLLGGNVNLFKLDENNKVLAYHRWQNGGAKDDVMVVVNLGTNLYENYDLGFPRNGTWRVRFNSSLAKYDTGVKPCAVPDVTVENGGGSVVLPPSSVLIFSQDN